MHVTTRRSYLDKYNESIFYSKRHISLTVVPARWVSIALLHPLLTLLSKLKTSKLKKTEKPGKVFSMAFSVTPRCKACRESRVQGIPSPVPLRWKPPPLQTAFICFPHSALSFYTTM